MITIYKYKPELQKYAQYFKSEEQLIKQLKKDMVDDIKTNNTSTQYLIDESYQIGETTELEFTDSQAINTLIKLLNQKNKTVEVKETDCWKCNEIIEHTEVFSFCPKCLTHL